MTTPQWWLRRLVDIHADLADAPSPVPKTRTENGDAQKDSVQEDRSELVRAHGAHLTLDAVQTPTGDASSGLAPRLRPSVHASDEPPLDIGVLSEVVKAQLAADKRAANELAAQTQITGALTKITMAAVPAASPNLPAQPTFDVKKDRLTVADLRAWQRCWGLSDSEVVLIMLAPVRQVLRLLYSPPHTRLPRDVSSRLRRFRVRSKARVLKMAEINPEKLKKLDSNMEKQRRGRNIYVYFGVIHGDSYMREALTHGLWPAELAYWRWWVGSGSLKRQGCLVIHSPTKVYAECDTYLSFAANRVHAESRLATRLAQHMFESSPNVAYRERRKRKSDGKTKESVKRAADDAASAASERSADAGPRKRRSQSGR